MRLYPALEVSWPSAPDEDTTDRLLAELDGAHPAAVEPHPFGIRIFFPTAAARDDAAAIARHVVPAARLDCQLVPDDDWAERSQAGLSPVHVGRILVLPGTPNAAPFVPAGAEPPPDIVITILPSMGFGTGHHESTRLCLGLLQRASLAGASVLDVGTGSGVLAIAAWRLGATRVIAVDLDGDALQSASDNLDLNHARGAVTLRQMDIARDAGALGPPFDVVLANLTGAMLERECHTLAALMVAHGTLVVSGFETHEDDAVVHAFQQARLAVQDRAVEGTWTALGFTRR